jgi:hypothetical protein
MRTAVSLHPVRHSAGPFGRITDHETWFTEVFLEHRASTQVVERPASPIVRALVAERLDAPLLAIMFHLLGGAEIVGGVCRF